MQLAKMTHSARLSTIRELDVRPILDIVKSLHLLQSPKYIPHQYWVFGVIDRPTTSMKAVQDRPLVKCTC